ncbi:hypothetical protein ABA31_02780 [Agrococcus baldri]|uniref:Uncharacterized protein n=1 Tax=Agrococcus baldri TaxID=153730 RepID=A0AA87RIP7_9MICO|nr:hypothetical protein ABA31_02780 [Agrococcus baldri]
MNRKRHGSAPSTSPESVGPNAGAAEMTTEVRPITRPRRCTGTSASVVVISSGSTMAVPPACTTRPSSSRPKPGAIAAIAVPARNSTSAVVNTVRVLSRLSRNPVVGMTTAIVSMNAVESHCAVTAVIASSVMSTGSATDRTVSFRIITNAVTTSTAMMGAGRMSGAGRPWGWRVRVSGFVVVTCISSCADARSVPPAGGGTTPPGLRGPGGCGTGALR